MAQLWGGRFTKETDQLVYNFNASISFDQKFYRQDIKGSIAHATMLGKTGIITPEESDQIVKELNAILEEVENGTLEIGSEYEDIHSFVEATLIDRIGDTGKKLHTGRSRNDQVHLRLHRRIALYTAHADEVHQIGGELGEFRNLTLDKQHALLGIETCCQIVKGHLDDILADLLRIVGIIRQSLNIGHKHEHTIVVARILQLDTTTQGAYIVSEMEFSGGTITGQNYFSHYFIYDLQIFDLRFIPIWLQRYE